MHTFILPAQDNNMFRDCEMYKSKVGCYNFLTHTENFFFFRFPKLHSSVIRTQVLLQHYSVALLAAARGQVQLQKHTSVETLEIVQCLLGSTRCCPSHHGYMLLLRIPFPCLAALAHQRLCHIRDRLGLHKHFEIVLGDPKSGIIVGKHFLSQLRV